MSLSNENSALTRRKWFCRTLFMNLQTFVLTKTFDQGSKTFGSRGAEKLHRFLPLLLPLVIVPGSYPLCSLIGKEKLFPSVMKLNNPFLMICFNIFVLTKKFDNSFHKNKTFSYIKNISRRNSSITNWN